MSVVPVTRGHHHVVSAGHELAALAAFEALDNGGNAIDAGVAAILTLGVVYSDQVSVAGVAPMIIRLAETGEVVTIAGVGGWPRALDPDAFIERHQGIMPLGVRRTVVPAAPDACLQALERWGTMTFRDVAARAVRYASEGFARHPVMLDYVRRYAHDMRHWPENIAVWMPGGEVPAPGDKLVQADLGRVLQFLCDEERAAGDDRMAGLAAVRRAFYRGDIASRILAHQREHDGLLEAEDLASFRCQVVPSMSRRFRFNGEEVAVHTCGAWCQGPFLLEALSIAEAAGVRSLQYGSDAYLHTIAETLKLTFADREGYLGDPDFVDVPLDTLVGESYAFERRKAIDPWNASSGMPPPGAIPGHTPYVPAIAASEEPIELPPDTSIVCVIDEQGNGLCSTPSDTSWDTPVVPGTGFTVSSRGAQSWAVRGHPSCLAPASGPGSLRAPAFCCLPGTGSCHSEPRAETPRSRRICRRSSAIWPSACSFRTRSRLPVWSPTAIPTLSHRTPPIPDSSPSKGASTNPPASGSPRAGTASSGSTSGRTGRAGVRSAQGPCDGRDRSCRRSAAF